MKTTLLSLAAVALLAGGAGAGFTAKSHELEMRDVAMQKAQLQSQKQLTMQIKMLENQISKSQKEMAKKPDVSENFIITEVENGNVRGKLAEGTGEGIYYPKGVFIDRGFGDIKVGEEYTITWTAGAYDNEDWSIIKEIGKIVK